MLYALDKINEDSQLLPDIKLGAILLDSCSSSTYALNQSLEFIRASINTVESSAFECKDKSSPRPKYGSKMIAGVIGGSYSEVSLQVANLLRLFRIPQVSMRRRRAKLILSPWRGPPPPAAPFACARAPAIVRRRRQRPFCAPPTRRWRANTNKNELLKLSARVAAA